LIKREARILGLSTRRKGRNILVVGVVFRGSLWLDGVISCSLGINGTSQNIALSEAIKGSKQYSQLHAIIVKKELVLGLKASLTDLARRVNLPVIAIMNRRDSKAPRHEMGPRGQQRYDIMVNGHHVSVLAVQISRKGVEQVFNVGCIPTNWMPEAVRVADLLVQQVSRSTFHNRQ
jgi:endonuclease V-like protein UPF0215 family